MQAWRRYAPARDARLCFLESQAPLLADLLQARDVAQPACLVPLFLNRGRHVRGDIPQLVAGLGVSVSEPLIDAEVIGEVMDARLQALSVAADHLLLYSHGSRGDSDTVAALAEALRRRHALPVRVVLASDGAQGLAEVLEAVRAAGGVAPVMLPHFLFDGHWRQRLEAQLADLRQRHALPGVAIAGALGEHPAMFALIEQRIRQCEARA